MGTAGTQTHPAIYTRIGNYNPLTRPITITVGQATPSYTIPTGITAVVGQTLSMVTLPSSWTWVTPNAPVGTIGTQTHDATFTPADTINFANVTRSVIVTVTVIPVGKMVSASRGLHSLAITTNGELWLGEPTVQDVLGLARAQETPLFQPV